MKGKDTNRFLVFIPQLPCFASLKLRESEEGGLIKGITEPPLGGRGRKERDRR